MTVAASLNSPGVWRIGSAFATWKNLNVRTIFLEMPAERESRQRLYAVSRREEFFSLTTTIPA